MKLFNGNARKAEATYVPATHYLLVANWIIDLAARGVPISDLEIQVHDGSLQLANEAVSYGRHGYLT